MAQKAITIYTPPDAGPHIFAEDDAQVHRGLIGGSGLLLADNQMACTIINNNTVRLASGVYSMQGFLICVEGGTSEDLTVESGTAGTYRHDLVVADFVRGGGNTADQFTLHVLRGTDAATEQAATDPALIEGDLISGASQRQEALYRLIIQGTTLASVERVANYIGNVYQ